MTEKQMMVLKFCRGHIRQKGFAPSIAEIAEAVKSNTTTVRRALSYLQDRGYIRKSSRWRDIEVLKRAA